MNVLTLAYKTAGGRPPTLRQRVWSALADNQDLTSKQVAAQINEGYAVVASTLGVMAKEEQVTFTMELRNGHYRPVMVFRAVTLPDGTMPLPTKRTVKKPAPPARVVEPTPPARVVEPVPKVEAPSPAPVVFTPPAPEKIDVLALSLREARRIYDQLKEYFNDDR